VIRFWDFAAFLANSVIFLLIGSREAMQPIAAFWRPALVGTLAVLAGRAAAIIRSPASFPPRMATDGLTRHILFWGACAGRWRWRWRWCSRGLPEHDALVSAAFAVVAFSIFVQG
jgi:CPA1 family monovalent cation:H+ antiporter